MPLPQHRMKIATGCRTPGTAVELAHSSIAWHDATRNPHAEVGASQLPDLIATVHRSLGELGQQPPAEQVLTPAVSVRQSVRHDYVVCLECGHRGKTLRRHISSRHSLSRAEYLRRWGLQPDHPLTAPAYSERRSTLAKQLGLGRKPKTEAALAPIPPTSATANGYVQVTPNPEPKPTPPSSPD